MILSLRAGAWEASVDALGAQLTSLRGRGREYIWQGAPNAWQEHSPFLFPIIGKLSGGYYTLDGRRYELGIHGFAQSAQWSVIAREEGRATLGLRADPETMARYPFRFRLESQFTLTAGGVVKVARRFFNEDSRKMPFCAGEHPGFNVPLRPDGDYDRCELVFEEKETASAHRVRDSQIEPEAEAYLEGEDVVPITRALLGERAVLVLTGIKSRRVTLRAAGRDVARVKIAGFLSLGVWSCAHPSAYVCVEPWYGLPSVFGGPTDMMEKRGVTVIEPGGFRAYSMDIEAL